MKYFIIKKEGIDLPTAICVREQETTSQVDRGDDIKTNTNLNRFISDNIELIRQISPIDPAISMQDEWYTEDYSIYDNMCNCIKQRGKVHGKRNQSMGHMARRFSIRRKP